MARSVEYVAQILIEMEDGSDVVRTVKDYVEGAIPKMFPTARDIRWVITIADEQDNVLLTKFSPPPISPSEALREKAWK